MSGIVFFGTRSLEAVLDCYVAEVGASVWLEQPDCTILRYDNLLLGFCERGTADTDGIVTFVSNSREDVNAAYEDLSERAESEPAVDERYDIYRFFATDPEGRTMEFQTFLHETDPV